MFSIILAAGWPIWPLLLASIIAVALIIERAIALRRANILPPGLLASVIGDYRQGGVNDEMLKRLDEHSPLGRVFAEAGLPRQAIEQFARSQHLVPGHPDTAFRLAEQFLFLADYSNALAAANQVLKLAPGSTDALLIKGCSLLGLQDYPLALDPLTQALSKQSNPRANLSRGLAHLELGNFDAAQQDYQQAARLLTNACPAWYGLAEVAYRRKDPPALIKYGSLLLSNAPPSLPEYRLVAARLAELRP